MLNEEMKSTYGNRADSSSWCCSDIGSFRIGMSRIKNDFFMDNSRDKQKKISFDYKKWKWLDMQKTFLMHHARLNIILFFDEQSASNESYICVGGDVSSIPTEHQKKT